MRRLPPSSTVPTPARKTLPAVLTHAEIPASTSANCRRSPSSSRTALAHHVRPAKMGQQPTGQPLEHDTGGLRVDARRTDLARSPNVKNTLLRCPCHEYDALNVSLLGRAHNGSAHQLRRDHLPVHRSRAFDEICQLHNAMTFPLKTTEPSAAWACYAPRQFSAGCPCTLSKNPPAVNGARRPFCQRYQADARPYLFPTRPPTNRSPAHLG